MARWRSLNLCKTCSHRQACDYRLPLGQAPNPLCPDGWAEGPDPAHMVPGPEYRPVSNEGKYTGTLRRERDRGAYQYSKRKFCLLCACWDKQHTPITNNSRTWLCRRHLYVYQKWQRARGLSGMFPKKAANKVEARRRAKRQAVLDALGDGARSLREIATVLEWSVELTRFHLNKLAGASRVEKIDMRRGQSWIAWQLV